MNLTVYYQAQLRQLAGVASEVVTLPEYATVLDLLCHLTQRRGHLASLLLSEARTKRQSLLLFVQDRQVDEQHVLHSGDEIVLMTPIAGGSV